jgi:hypothetical protein
MNDFSKGGDNGPGFILTQLQNADDPEPRLAAKRIKRDKEIGYGKGKNWTFTPHQFPTHEQFATYLSKLAADPFSFIVRGAMASGLDP